MVEFLSLAPSQSVASRRKRVLLVDDHAVVRKGLAALINEEFDMEVCGDFDEESTALAAAARLKPDVAVVDWSLGPKDASELIKNLHQFHPQMPVLVLSMHDEIFYVERVLRLGARGYVMKRDAAERIVEGIRQTSAGHWSFTQRALEALPDDLKAKLREPAAETRLGATPQATAAASPASKADLVIAPHPDDETFGCGGTIRLVAESGTPVDVVFMTRGELGHEDGQAISAAQQAALAQQRTTEAIEACKALGVRRVSFLDGKDTLLREQIQLAGDLLSILKQQPLYRRVFCPWKHDGHRDHQATFSLLQTALRAYPGPLQVWLYEVWTPLGFNMLIPIDRTVPHKKRAIQQYHSQLPQLNYRDGFLGLSAYRSTFCPPANFAEAFFVCTKEEMLAL